MEAQKFSCLCIYHLFPHTFPCAKVQKTLPGLVPSNWFGGKPADWGKLLADTLRAPARINYSKHVFLEYLSVCIYYCLPLTVLFCSALRDCWLTILTENVEEKLPVPSKVGRRFSLALTPFFRLYFWALTRVWQFHWYFPARARHHFPHFTHDRKFWQFFICSPRHATSDVY